MSLSVSVCRCMSLSVPVCPCMFLSVNVCQCLSLYFQVCHRFSLLVPFLSLALSCKNVSHVTSYVSHVTCHKKNPQKTHQKSPNRIKPHFWPKNSNILSMCQKWQINCPQLGGGLVVGGGLVGLQGCYRQCLQLIYFFFSNCYLFGKCPTVSGTEKIVFSCRAIIQELVASRLIPRPFQDKTILETVNAWMMRALWWSL